MDRAQAEGIYDSGREACVEFILDLAGRFAQHEDRLKRLGEQVRQDSRKSSKSKCWLSEVPCRSCGELHRVSLVGADASEPRIHLVAGEVPGERFGDLVVELFERGEALLDVVEVGEVGGVRTLRCTIER